MDDFALRIGPLISPLKFQSSAPGGRVLSGRRRLVLPLDVRRGPADRADAAQRFTTTPKRNAPATGGIAGAGSRGCLSSGRGSCIRGLYAAEDPEDERHWTARARDSLNGRVANSGEERGCGACERRWSSLELTTLVISTACRCHRIWIASCRRFARGSPAARRPCDVPSVERLTRTSTLSAPGVTVLGEMPSQEISQTCVWRRRRPTRRWFADTGRVVWLCSLSWAGNTYMALPSPPTLAR